MAGERHQRMEAGQRDIAQQGAMRDAAHAEPADDARVQQRGRRHEHRDQREDRGEQLRRMEDVDEDLLRRVDEAEQAAEHEGDVYKRQASGMSLPPVPIATTSSIS